MKQYKKMNGKYEEIYPETGAKMTRPKVRFFLASLKVLLVIIASGALSLCIVEFLKQEGFLPAILSDISAFIVLFLLFIVLSILFFLKRIAIFSIRVYQRYAPYELRSRCVFVPSCSEYMILAIKKYGLVKGIKKGIDRFYRCNADNFGEDYP